MGAGVVLEGLDQRVALERGLDDGALDAAAAAVDEAERPQAGFVGGSDVFLHDRRNVIGRERVQIEFGFDRDWVRSIALRHAARSQSGFAYSATTVVVMPPRAVNAPVTVIRRGRQAATRSSRIRLVTAS